MPTTSAQMRINMCTNSHITTHAISWNTCISVYHHSAQIHINICTKSCINTHTQYLVTYTPLTTGSNTRYNANIQSSTVRTNSHTDTHANQHALHSVQMCTYAYTHPYSYTSTNICIHPQTHTTNRAKSVTCTHQLATLRQYSTHTAPLFQRAIIGDKWKQLVPFCSRRKLSSNHRTRMRQHACACAHAEPEAVVWDWLSGRSVFCVGIM